MAESRHYRTVLERDAFWAQVLAMREQGLTYREVGDKLGLSPNRARQIVLTARQAASLRGCEA